MRGSVGAARSARSAVRHSCSAALLTEGAKRQVGIRTLAAAQRVAQKISWAGQQRSCEAEVQDPTPRIPGDDHARRRHAPATLRNREPIARVLREQLPVSGKVLEVASGSGEHCAFFAGLFPGLVWQPTDPDPDALGSIAGWCAGLANVLPPLALDATAADWPVAAADAVLCINMAHISPWQATLGLVTGAGRLLADGAPLILYGPWRRAGVQTAPSNEAFDASLKARDPRWGLRRVEDLDAAAGARGFARTRLIEMPANNVVLVYRRARSVSR
ncbi:MAG: DUF938 domain-containing protein [Ideonella sp.]|nr:DUF938 domain-containing protein [Ideonella sp.]